MQDAAGKVFVSYSSADRSRVAGLVPLLEALGHDVFFDRRSIRAGQKWRNRIDASIADAGTMIVFWTRRAQRSKWVRYEYERFAVLHPDATLTAVLGDETPPAPLLAERQSTDFAPLINELLAMQRRLQADGIKHDAVREALLNRLREAGIELDEKKQRKLMRLFVPAGLAGLVSAPAFTLGNFFNVSTDAVATLSLAQAGVVAAAAVGGAVVCNVTHNITADTTPPASTQPSGLNRGATLPGNDNAPQADPPADRQPSGFNRDAPVDGPHPAAPNPVTPAPEPATVDCDLINCDCANLDAGLLTGPWRDECRNQERALRGQCEQTDTMPSGPCQMSGPNPFPPE